MDKKEIIATFIIFTILASGTFYATFADKAQIRIDDDKSTFYVPHEDYPWIWTVSGREINSLFDGSSKMNRDRSSIEITYEYDNLTEVMEVQRSTRYIRGPVIIDHYTFYGGNSTIEAFPVSHRVQVINGSGYIYQWELRDIIYDGPTVKNVDSPQKFGKKMEAEWDADTSYWNTLYKSEILKARWRVDSNNFSTNVRFFDPSCPAGMIGDNTVASPCRVTTCTELQNISINLSGNYIVANDIDCSDTINWNSGAGFIPIGDGFSTTFSGYFDGNHYTISDLFVNRTTSYAGLFGKQASSGTIANVTVYNATIMSTSAWAGGIIGQAAGSSNQYLGVVNSSVTGLTFVGGVFGEITDATNYCYSENTVVTSSGATVGGIVGQMITFSRMFNSYAKNATVTGTQRVGGAVGYMNTATFENGYATGTVTATDADGDVGGFVGWARNSAYVFEDFSMNATFAATVVNGEQDNLSNGLAGLTTEQLDLGGSGDDIIGSSEGPLWIPNTHWFDYATTPLYQEDSDVSYLTNTVNYAIYGFNYTKRSDATGVIWQVKHGNNQPTYNITLPSTCYSGSVVQVRFDTAKFDSQAQCYNGTDWEYVGTNYTCGSDPDSFSPLSWTSVADGDYATGVHTRAKRAPSSGIGDFMNAAVGSNPNFCGNVYEEGIWWTRTPSGNATSCYGDSNSSNGGVGDYGCTQHTIEDYYYNYSSEPMASWDFSTVWNDTNNLTDYPTLIWPSSAALADITAPVISNIASSNINATYALITWTTDEDTNASVNYGTTTSLGTQVDNTTLSTSNQVPLPSLSQNILYYYNVTSCDAADNCNTSGPNSFRTTNIITINFSGSGIQTDLATIEQGTNITVNATFAGAANICIDSDYPGVDITCVAGDTVQVYWDANSKWDTFENSSGNYTAVNLTFSGAGQQSINITRIINDSLIEAINFSLFGYIDTTYAKNVIVDVDSDGTLDVALWGELIGGNTFSDEWNDSETEKFLNFNETSPLKSYLKLPKINVSSIVFNITGDQGTRQDSEDRVLTIDDHYATRCRSAYDTTNDRACCFGGNTPPIQSGTAEDNCTTVTSGFICNNNAFCWGKDDSSITTTARAPRDIGAGSCAIYWDDTTGSGGRGYIIIGGFETVTNFGEYNHSQHYDPADDSWTQLANITTGFWEGACIGDEANDKIYVFGGSTSIFAASTLYLNNTQIYDVVADSWSQGSEMPMQRAYHWAEWFNTTHIMVWGGLNNSATDLYPYPALYDVAGDSWTELTDPDDQISVDGVTGLKIGDYIYSIGGSVSGVEDADLKRYDVNNGAWETMDNNSPQESIARDSCDEVGDYGVCMYSSADFFTYCVRDHDCGNLPVDYKEFYVYPEDPVLQVDSSSTSSWNVTGPFTTTVGVNITSEVNTLLESCTATDGYCTLTLYWINKLAGSLNVTGLNISTVLPTFNLSSRNVTCSAAYCNTQIDVNSTQQGIVELNSLSVPFLGYSSYTWTANTSADESNATAEIFYSEYDFAFPQYIDWLEFIPQQPTDKNVTPYGQGINQPIFNITGLNNDGKDFNFTVLINDSHSCVDLFIGNTSVPKDFLGQTATVYCYQESANVSTACGGLDTGVYSYSNSDPYVYINYTIPSTVLTGQWQVKHSINATYNNTIPAACLSGSVFEARMYSFRTASWGECYNSTDWIVATYQANLGGSYGTNPDTSPLATIDGDYNTFACFATNWESACPAASGNSEYSRWYEEGVWWEIPPAYIVPTADTLYEVKTNVSEGESFGLWMSADYNCTTTGWELWDPEIYFRSCCVGCICGEEVE